MTTKLLSLETSTQNHSGRMKAAIQRRFYDHAFVSSSLESAVVSDSWDVLREEFFSDMTSSEYKDVFSDHMPVLFKLKDVDSDDKPSGEYAKPRSTEQNN